MLSLKESIILQMISEELMTVFLNVFLWSRPGSGKSFTAWNVGIDKKLKSSFSKTGRKC